MADGVVKTAILGLNLIQANYKRTTIPKAKFGAAKDGLRRYQQKPNKHEENGDFCILYNEMELASAIGSEITIEKRNEKRNINVYFLTLIVQLKIHFRQKYMKIINLILFYFKAKHMGIRLIHSFVLLFSFNRMSFICFIMN